MTYPIDGAAAGLIQQQSQYQARLWKVTRTDGTEYTFTDHDTELPYDGETVGDVYSPAEGVDVSAVELQADMATTSAEISGILGVNKITSTDIVAGLFSNALVVQIVVDWRAPYLGPFRRDLFWLRDINSAVGFSFSGTLGGIGSWLDLIAGFSIARPCDNELGDRRLDGLGFLATSNNGASRKGCRVKLLPTVVGNGSERVVGPVSAGATSMTIENLTTGFEDGDRFKVDGDVTVYRSSGGSGLSGGSETVTFTPILAVAIPGGTTPIDIQIFHFTGAQVAVVNDDRNILSLDDNAIKAGLGDDLFIDGRLEWTSGNNTGQIMQIKKALEGGGGNGEYSFEFMRETPFAIVIGDLFKVTSGCRKTLFVDCIGVYGNVENNHGFDTMPGRDRQLNVK